MWNIIDVSGQNEKNTLVIKQRLSDFQEYFAGDALVFKCSHEESCRSHHQDLSTHCGIAREHWLIIDMIHRT